MQWFLRFAVTAILLVLAAPAAHADGAVIKVLPEFLDLKGRNSVSPSLYERDVYQVTLREHPERQSGMRFYIQWKTKATAWEPLLMRVELRGIAEGRLPRSTLLEQTLANPGGHASHWAELTINGLAYKTSGQLPPGA